MLSERQGICTMVNKNKQTKLGRPREFDEADVLTRAATAFLKDGFEAVSYERIARDVGLSKPSLYNSFGDKTALFERALSDYAAKAHDHLATSFSDAESLQNAVEEIFNAAARIYSRVEEPSVGCLLVGTALPATSQHDTIQKTLSDFTQKLELSLKHIITDQYQQDSTRTRSTPEQTANHICSLIFALAVRARMGLSQKQMLSTARDFAKLVA